VVWNLLVNAVKFSEPGGAVSVEVRDGAEGMIQIVVQDAGAGIDAEFLPHVFERFRQADTSTHREHGGLGRHHASLAACAWQLQFHRLKWSSSRPGSSASRMTSESSSAYQGSTPR
jgi:K+-sensing histidine kinase KdpD